MILLNNSCASLPPVPQGTSYLTDVSTSSAYGHDIPLSVQGKPSPTVIVPFDQMNRWICYDPTTATNIQTYIQEIIKVAQAKCQP